MFISFCVFFDSLFRSCTFCSELCLRFWVYVCVLFIPVGLLGMFCSDFCVYVLSLLSVFLSIILFSLQLPLCFSIWLSLNSQLCIPLSLVLFLSASVLFCLFPCPYWSIASRQWLPWLPCCHGMFMNLYILLVTLCSVSILGSLVGNS